MENKSFLVMFLVHGPLILFDCSRSNLFKFKHKFYNTILMSLSHKYLSTNMMKYKMYFSKFVEVWVQMCQGSQSAVAREGEEPQRHHDAEEHVPTFPHQPQHPLCRPLSGSPQPLLSWRGSLQRCQRHPVRAGSGLSLHHNSDRY